MHLAMSMSKRFSIICRVSLPFTASMTMESIGQARSQASQPAELTAEAVPHIHADHSLDIPLQRMGAMHLDVLPVVRRDNLRRLVGIVTLSGVLHAFGIDL